MEVGWCYEFYKVYKTKPEDCFLWCGKDVDLLPDHLQFFSNESTISAGQSDIDEIRKYLEPITMMEEGRALSGYLGTLYKIAAFGRNSYEVEYKSPRSGWYHFVKLTNKRAKRMIRFAFRFSNRPKVALDGYLGKKNEHKHYPGKLKNVVYFMCQ